MPPSRVSPPPFGDDIHGLTAEQIDAFYRDGYLIIPDYLSRETCSDLLNKTRTMLKDFSLADHPMTRFVTGQDADGTSNGSRHVGDDYFLSSGDKVRFFFEDDAFDKTTGELTKPKERAINKIGHNLHGLVPEFGAVSHAGKQGRKNAAIARDLGFTDPRLLQSMVICKQPEIGGAVPPHQDSTFLFTHRPSAVGFWIALEDATAENGCLSFAPGSHRRAPIRERFVRTLPVGGEGGENTAPGTTFEFVSGDDQWPRNLDRENHDIAPAKNADLSSGSSSNSNANDNPETYVLGEVTAGTLVLIHGNILHKSEKNVSQKGRIIYTFHLIEGTEHYDEWNWLQIPGGPSAFTRLDGTAAT